MDIEKIEICRIGFADIEQLQLIGKQTFTETFAEGNSEENLQKYLKEGFTIKKLSSELSNQNSEFYFAKLDNKIIGYLKVNFGQAQTELSDRNTLEIERIYVLKQYHGKKAGQILYEKALDIAIFKCRIPLVRSLGGEPKSN